ncbi:MurR/RpiR family transcriptional regulator [Facklamia sp. DSM 111018]|uniref:MurR/RpiR family transcriptional regulator n=1 Tax=Facklamia lactis TaxID=2749967 RepID=A0ABS0LRU4_9LACT|nr:MurR/RpiR family transcriptional regulator [Facklamia lactis]MBG9981084.1 MurR/RpiR family transcriptional regulator [Facklamia lactis]MBG9986885.1 MurR/RpiR family transcriptional regulator [Facklamia lactis]
MNLVQFMKLRESLSPTEALVFDFCYENKAKLEQMTIQSLANQLYISPATISRMAQKMGFSGFKEYKYTLLLLNTEPISRDQPLPDYLEHYQQEVVQNINHTFQSIHLEQIESFMDWMTQAQSIEVFAIGGSSISGLDFARKLQSLNYNIHARQDWDDLLRISKLLKANDLAIFFSLSGTTKLILDCANNLLANGVKMIAFVGNPEAELLERSDLSFVCPSIYHYQGEADLSSRISFNTLTDLLIWRLNEKN